MVFGQLVNYIATVTQLPGGNRLSCELPELITWHSITSLVKYVTECGYSGVWPILGQVSTRASDFDGTFNPARVSGVLYTR